MELFFNIGLVYLRYRLVNHIAKRKERFKCPICGVPFPSKKIWKSIGRHIKSKSYTPF
jgi:hypothetical protein